MRFDSKVIAAGIVGMAATVNAAPSDACDAAVVTQAGQEGILKYVITNCLESATAGVNYAGTTLLGPSVCLAQWIADHQTGTPIPETGDCRVAYQDFVIGAAANWSHGISNDIMAFGCSYNASTDVLTLTDDCAWNYMNNGGSSAAAVLDVFKAESGHYINGQQCPAVTVRKWAIGNAYHDLVVAAMTGAGTDDTEPFGATIVSDGGNGICYTCYHGFAAAVKAGGAADGTLKSACAADPASTDCMSSTALENALAEFVTCTGGFDIQFIGPVCAQSEINAVQALIPMPYYTLTYCAYNPTANFCAAINTYISEIQVQSDSSCVLCYQDFYNTMIENAQDADNVAKCTGSGDIWDANCYAVNGAGLANFAACSGFGLDTVKPTATPPIVVTTTAAPDTTTAAPVTTTVAPDTTTAAPVTTTTVAPTTKSSTITSAATSLLLLAAAFVL